MDKLTLQQLKQLRKKLKEQKKAPVAKSSVKPIDDRTLFAQAMQGVKPLAGEPKFAHPQSVISPWPRKNQPVHVLPVDDMSDFWPWDELQQGEQLLFARPGLRLDTLRKLKRGDYPIEAELDLHGESTDSARPKVAQFLSNCRIHGWRCVRIIHGKGLSSRDGMPVLKLKLKNWLAQRDEVLAFSQANIAQGHAGAVLVLLKQDKKR